MSQNIIYIGIRLLNNNIVYINLLYLNNTNK